MTVIRFNVAFDDGKIICEVDDICYDLERSFAVRLVRAGLAEYVEGNEGIKILRESAGLPPLPLPLGSGSQ